MTRWVAVVSGLVAAGCLQNNLTPCGDGLCPAGKECHAPTGGCFGPEQLEACAGKIDFDPCDVNGFVGFCLDGVCLFPKCGDGFLQPGEECDDGFAANTDDPAASCRPDCRPARCGDGVQVGPELCDPGVDATCPVDCGIDTCGNGILDNGEECDDANDDARDGCSACLQERLVVQQLTGASPRSRVFAAIAYDPARERLIVFGGKSLVGGFRADTLEWDGVRWREVKPTTSPTGRESAVAAYDSTRHRVVLFGGNDGTLRDDFWQYDGANWTELPRVIGAPWPAARMGHVMAYDPVAKKLVLFGGRDTNGRLGDTWTWDGAQWSDVTPSGGPPPTEGAAMAFDPVRGTMVMVGGRTADDAIVATTWIWDGTTWGLFETASPPPPRERATAAFDAVRGTVVMASGRDSNGNLTGDTFEWNGSVWTPAQSLPFLPPNEPFMTYDSARREVMGVLSFTGGSIGFRRPATSASWSFVFGSGTIPQPRVHGAAAYDAFRGKIVLYGGQLEDALAPVETWEWDGKSWLQRGTSNPGQRDRPAMAFSNSNGIVMTAGAADGRNADLWAWNGSVWTQIDPPDPMLGSRHGAELVYDAARDALVLHGSRFEGDQTFEWDSLSTTWIQTEPESMAFFRHNFAMVYDPLRARTDVLGGRNISDFTLRSPVEYDGATLAPIDNPGGLVARGGRAVFDPFRKRVVYLFDPEESGLQIWNWDGATWTADSPQPGFTPLYRPAVAFDNIRGEIILVGGRTGANGQPFSTASLALVSQPNTPVEACTYATLDYDGDGKAGCEDPECFGRCTPGCPPGASCAVVGSSCGDGTCNTAIEDCKICPQDCEPCTVNTECGDFRCDEAEDATLCPGDCS